jgi:hypothetical protein
VAAKDGLLLKNYPGFLLESSWKVKDYIVMDKILEIWTPSPIFCEKACKIIGVKLKTNQRAPITIGPGETRHYQHQTDIPGRTGPFGGDATASTGGREQRQPAAV